MEENNEKMSVFAKYKWLYLWIAAAALVVFSAIMLINKAFGQSVVFYLTGVLLIAFVIIRFVPLIKTTRNRWAITMISIELFIDLVVGILMIVLTAKLEDKDTLYKMYPFFVGGVLYVRAAVYFAETAFFGTKPEVVKFLVHLALITAGAVIMGRYNDFNVESMRWLLGVAFAIAGVAATADGTINYNNYRKLYAKPRKEKVKKDEVEDAPEKEIEDPLEAPQQEQQTTIIEEPKDDRPQDYIS